MKMLVIDDEAPIRRFLSEVALSQGVAEVDVAESGEDALTYVIRNAYDLITLDLHMPGASGLEILTLVRNMCPHAVIAIVSGKVTEGSLVEMGGCVDLVIHKPAQVDVLMNLIRLVQARAENLLSIRDLSDEKLPEVGLKGLE